METTRRSFLAMALTAGLADVAQAKPCESIIFFGAYGPAGIYRSRLDAHKGLSKPELAYALRNATWLEMCGQKNVLYAASEVSNERGTGGMIASFSVSEEGALTLLSKVSSRGDEPVHISLHPSQPVLLAANYSTPAVAVIRIGPRGELVEGDSANFTDGVLPDGRRSHFHMVGFDPVGRFVVVADAGTDRLLVGALDATFKLTFDKSYPTGKGTAPRHFVFSKSGTSLYALTEKTGEIQHYRFAEGRLELRERLMPSYLKNASGPAASEICCSRDGRFVYVASRGNNVIACFRVSEDDTLRYSAQFDVHGDYPRGFLITAEHLICCNQRGNTVSLFKLDPASGQLAFADPTTPISRPACAVEWCRR